jgi:DNA-binding transcriptional MerR regulator
MHIGELSARSGATVRMLRYYEEHGLLAPERTPAGYRRFGEADVLRVRYIRCMLASALPTHVVAQAVRFLLDEQPQVPTVPAERAHLAAVLQSELAALDERIAILERSRQQLARFVEDVRGQTVGPQQPHPDGCADAGPAVRRAGPRPPRSASPRSRRTAEPRPARSA